MKPPLRFQFFIIYFTYTLNDHIASATNAATHLRTSERHKKRKFEALSTSEEDKLSE